MCLSATRRHWNSHGNAKVSGQYCRVGVALMATDASFDWKPRLPTPGGGRVGDCPPHLLHYEPWRKEGVGLVTVDVGLHFSFFVCVFIFAFKRKKKSLAHLGGILTSHLHKQNTHSPCSERPSPPTVQPGHRILAGHGSYRGKPHQNKVVRKINTVLKMDS